MQIERQRRGNENELQVEREYSYQLDIVYNVCLSSFRTALLSRNRYRPEVFLRAIYFKLAREHAPDSLSLIGKKISRDHATVLHGIRVIFENDIKKSETLKREYLLLSQKIKDKIIANRKKTLFNSTNTSILLHSKINLKQELEQLKKSISNIPPKIKKEYSI